MPPGREHPQNVLESGSRSRAASAASSVSSSGGSSKSRLCKDILHAGLAVSGNFRRLLHRITKDRLLLALVFE